MFYGEEVARGSDHVGALLLILFVADCCRRQKVLEHRLAASGPLVVLASVWVKEGFSLSGFGKGVS